LTCFLSSMLSEFSPPCVVLNGASPGNQPKVLSDV
jgi:hypothetical protein